MTATITIRYMERGVEKRIPVEAQMVGEFLAVHPAYRTSGFSITHVPTGLALFGPMKERTAKDIARKLAALPLPWESKRGTAYGAAIKRSPELKATIAALERRSLSWRSLP